MNFQLLPGQHPSTSAPPLLSFNLVPLLLQACSPPASATLKSGQRSRVGVSCPPHTPPALRAGQVWNPCGVAEAIFRLGPFAEPPYDSAAPCVHVRRRRAVSPAPLGSCCRGVFGPSALVRSVLVGPSRACEQWRLQAAQGS